MIRSKFIVIFFFISCLSLSQTKTFLKAQHYFSLAKYNQALPLYKKAIKRKKNQGCGIIFFRVAECYRLGEDTIIKSYYTKYIDYIQKHSCCHNPLQEKINEYKRLGLSYYFLEDFEKAEINFERSIALGLNDINSLKYYYFTLVALDKKEKASKFKNSHLDAFFIDNDK